MGAKHYAKIICAGFIEMIAARFLLAANGAITVAYKLSW